MKTKHFLQDKLGIQELSFTSKNDDGIGYVYITIIELDHSPTLILSTRNRKSETTKARTRRGMTRHGRNKTTNEITLEWRGFDRSCTS